MTNPFDDDVIAAITRHMNEDHAADTLIMCRGVGGHPTATDAKMNTFDGDGGDYTVTVDGTETPCRILWDKPLTERSEVRPEIVRIYRESLAMLDD